MNDVTIIIIGMTGDLAKRKLIPALYELAKDKVLDKFLIIGAGLETAACREILTASREFISQIDENSWSSFCAHCYYQPVDVQNVDALKFFTQFVKGKERSAGLEGNRLLYCSTSADLYCPITQNSALAGLIWRTEPQDVPWVRVVYEKPFGHDAASAHSINDCLANIVHDEQIYRVDHYLTQEMVSNIALVRFTNCVFEPLWNNKYIEQVQIILDESIGLEGRGNLYDKTGALSDVVQNHLLELVALVAMEAPDCLTGQCIRKERARVLEQVTVVDALLGQCDLYRQEVGVNKTSETETFAAALITVNNPRWAGVPFYIRTGKYLAKKETEIRIHFKKVDCPLAQQCGCQHNILTIQIAPHPSFALQLNVKKPGIALEMIPVNMEFCHHCMFKERTAYEILFEELFQGQHSVSVRVDEIEYAWKIVDGIKRLNRSIYTYKQASSGPAELKDFEKTHEIKE